MRQCTLLMVILLSVLTVGRTHAEQDIILKMRLCPSVWSQSSIGEKLRIQFSRNQGLRIIEVADDNCNPPDFPVDAYNLDSLVAWGTETGTRYLMFVDVHSERLERKKKWHLPLVFHMYETVAAIEGELRYVDLSRGRLILAESFKVEEKAASCFQPALYDDINDPRLIPTVTAKVRLFDRLEDKLCRNLVDLVSANTRAR
ncbi:MAG: hypothetical protein U9R56_01030 [candidate division Zixibacteria bacterium]|nr:hypothetical protein [candidate division Zixibacteria bacterium]